MRRGRHEHPLCVGRGAAGARGKGGRGLRARHAELRRGRSRGLHRALLKGGVRVRQGQRGLRFRPDFDEGQDHRIPGQDPELAGLERQADGSARYGARGQVRPPRGQKVHHLCERRGVPVRRGGGRWRHGRHCRLLLPQQARPRPQGRRAGGRRDRGPLRLVVRRVQDVPQDVQRRVLFRDAVQGAGFVEGRGARERPEPAQGERAAVLRGDRHGGDGGGLHPRRRGDHVQAEHSPRIL
mmetsp:Transcript_6404/g.19331  ORF Transcript_6404/g.19331 Transcript_6404/m.19331 type:complete len:239 (+) Transcript_6404:1184-1900(+)